MSGTVRSQRHLAKWVACLGIAVGPTLLSAATPAGQPTRTQGRTTPRAAMPPTGQSTSAMPAAAPRASKIASVAPATGVAPVSATFCDEAVEACDSCVMPGPRGGIGCLPIWGQFEYLMWWDRDASVPALVTTSTANTPRDDAGVLGISTTSTLFGGDVQTDSLSGGRVTLGLWIDECQRFGIFGRGFSLEDQSANFATSSTGTDILARPFFNAFTDEEDALLLGFPNSIAGDIAVAQDTDTTGAQALVRQAFRAGGNYRIDLVYGYRYLGVDETLRIDNTLEFIDPNAGTLGTSIAQTDLFQIENEFHGGELGLMGHSVDGRWTLDFLATVALGSMNQLATVSGSTVTTPAAGAPVSVEGGLLTQSSNIGVFKDDPFSVVPEVTVTLGYFITPKLDFSIGYTFLYIDHVARPGDVIDTRVNLSQQTGQLDGPANPEFVFNDSAYWLQGLNFGLNLRY